MNYLIVVFLTCFLSFYPVYVTASDIERDKDDESESVQIINGQPVIFLDDDTQEISGLVSLKLKQVEFRAEYIAYGKAIKLSPLLTIRSQYLLATAQQSGAKARLMQAEKNISRLHNLHENDAISTRKLQKQQTQWQSDKATYNSSHYQSQVIINNSLLHWGKTLTQWVTDIHSKQFKQLINGEIILLQITLPAISSLPPLSNTIYINPTGDRNLAFAASFISPLPQVDTFSQGLQYIFQTENSTIKPGMNFTAWIPQKKQTQTGVIIPESSIAWHLGLAFVFIKIDEEHFVHRNISKPIKVPDGYFIANQFADGEEIVVTGTQMLLSHEFRSQIPDEDDDD
jgi:hypothetical protein